MSSVLPSLDDLRRRIDQIDDELQDLLIRRSDVVGMIARLKKADDTPPLRPGREARILRRLVARHRGSFSRAILVRLWRELLSGTTAMQADIQVAVFAPGNSAGLWDLARDHYGSQTPMTGYRTIGEVIGAVSGGRAMLGVLPFPQQDEPGAWWRLLMPAELPKPRVIARLPFGARGNARAEGGDALVIGRIAPEPSGDDRSLYTIETGADVSRGRLVSVLTAAGLPASLLAASAIPGAGTAQLIEFAGWLEPDDARLKEAVTSLGDKITRVAVLGFYAQPLSAEALAGATETKTERA